MMVVRKKRLNRLTLDKTLLSSFNDVCVDILTKRFKYIIIYKKKSMIRFDRKFFFFVNCGQKND